MQIFIINIRNLIYTNVQIVNTYSGIIIMKTLRLKIFMTLIILLERNIEKNFKRKINLIKKYISSGNLLEIGSAYGFFLNLIKNQFNIMGFEICKDAANYAKYNFDINLISKEFNTYNFNKSFDLICMWDVIEHLINPDIIIKKISQVIKPGGYLFLSTGDISRIVPSLRKEKWRLIHPPSHIHYFSKKTLELILKNHGFSIISIEYPGIWRSFHQLLSSMFNIKSVYKYIPGKFYINFFDIMEVVAKKNEE